MDFNYNIEDKDGVSVVRLNGSLLDRQQVDGLLGEVEEFVLEGKTRFLIEMEHVKYINSTGLNVLVSILTKARKAGGEVVISCVSAKVKELLVITKLIMVFVVTDSLEEGLSKFKKD